MDLFILVSARILKINRIISRADRELPEAAVDGAPISNNKLCNPVHLLPVMRPKPDQILVWLMIGIFRDSEILRIITLLNDQTFFFPSDKMNERMLCISAITNLKGQRVQVGIVAPSNFTKYTESGLSR